MNTRAETVNSDAGSYFNRIAHAYDRHRSPGGPHDEVLKRLATVSQAKHVLEIGSGTGNSAMAFIESYPCVPIGLDLSREMLRQASDKDIAARWVNCHAEHIPLSDASMEFIYSVLAFHLIDDAQSCLRECYRVLSSGICAIVTSPEEFIRTHIMSRYFPSFSKIDLERFQSEHVLVQYMKTAGFVEVECTYCSDHPKPINTAYVDRIANRFISTFALIPDDEFQAGLSRLRADIEATGQLEEPMIWQSVVVSGRKE